MAGGGGGGGDGGMVTDDNDGHKNATSGTYRRRWSE